MQIGYRSNGHHLVEIMYFDDDDGRVNSAEIRPKKLIQEDYGECELCQLESLDRLVPALRGIYHFDLDIAQHFN